jgi:hypothetical protein
MQVSFEPAKTKTDTKMRTAFGNSAAFVSNVQPSPVRNHREEIRDRICKLSLIRTLLAGILVAEKLSFAQ